MAILDTLFRTLFGGGRNVIKETAEVFLENAEAAGLRDANMRAAALAQFAAEFAPRNRGIFDRFMDGLNRIPRPLMAFGTIGLCISAMVDPIWFATRMQGIALVPAPLWWLLGAIVSFYFGARYQFKSQEFQSSIAASMAQVPQVAGNITALRALQAGATTTPRRFNTPVEVTQDPNPALDAWMETRDE